MKTFGPVIALFVFLAGRARAFVVVQSASSRDFLGGRGDKIRARAAAPKKHRAAHHVRSTDREIPNRLVFNYKVNLLDESCTEKPDHQANVKRIIASHPDMKVMFYDDAMCRASIATVHSEALAGYFDKETFGPYKSDICRLASLYEGGGYYFDTDLDIIQDVRNALPADATLATVVELGHDTDVFQAFVAAVPGHPILKEALDRSLALYQSGDPIFRGTPIVQQNGKGSTEWMGPKIFGETLLQAAGVATLASGPLELKELQEPYKKAYLLRERRDRENFLQLPPHEGKGCCCDVFVSGDTQVVFWSRFVGAGSHCSKH